MDYIIWSQILLELALAVSGEQYLDIILKKAVSAFLRKLDCTHIGVLQQFGEKLETIYSAPQFMKNDPNYLSIIPELKNGIQPDNSVFQFANETIYYVYPLKHFGFLVMGRKIPLEKGFQQELKPIIDMLAQNCCNSLEITKRKEIEDILEKERLLLKTAINSIPDLFSYKDKNGIYRLINEAFAKFRKREENEFIGFSDEHIFPREIAENHYEIDKKVSSTGSIFLCEEELTNFQGDTVPFESIRVPVYDEQENYLGLVCISRDISVRKKNELDLIEAKKQADSANLLKGQFLANMSHEIRTPLNGIIGFTELLMETNLNETQLQYTETANLSGKTLLGIINDILDFSKIEAGKLDLELIETDLYDLIEQTADIVKYQLRNKSLDLILNISTNLPDLVKIDPVRLKQILINLLNNALKFTEKGEVELKVDFSQYSEDQGLFSFSVRDTGIGISPQKQKKLFKAFSQADTSSTRKFGGTGLGLVIANMLAEKMGGRISVQSSEGFGSTFHFEFITYYKKKKKFWEKENILIKQAVLIDDNQKNLLVLSNYLESLGIEIKKFQEQAEGLKYLEKNETELLIFDLPVINNQENHLENVLAELNKFKRTVPVILLHGFFDERFSFEKYREKGFAHNIIKPVKIRELYKLLHSIGNNEPSKNEKKISGEDPLYLNLKKDNSEPVILLVDDVSTNLLLLKILLKKFFPQTKIIEASNGVDAFEITRDQKIDLIMMDVQMPELDGTEATKMIRKLENKSSFDLPIIAVTAGALRDEREKALESGMNDFITKPVDPIKLKEMIIRYLFNFEQTEKVS